MFGNTNGSLSERSRGWRNAFTSSAWPNRLRFSSSTIHGSPQISLHAILSFPSAHGGAMIQCLSKFVGERSSIEGGVDFGVVVEINIHVALARGGLLIRDQSRVLRLFSFSPMFDAIRPPIELLVAVTAHIKLLGSVEAAVSEIRREIFGVGPFPGSIRNNKRDVVAAKQREEFGHHEAGVPNFHGVANRPGTIRFRPGAALQFRVMIPRQSCCGPAVAWQKLEELGESLRVPPEVRRKLPENRPEFFAKAQNP